MEVYGHADSTAVTWVIKMNNRHIFVIFASIAFCSLSSVALADDNCVKQAKTIAARDFDATLPDQPIEKWLRANIPAEYDLVWGEHITDCGESTGTDIDKERNMPLCAEVEIKDESEVKGYLSLIVGTQTGGLLKDGFGIYFGYLDHRGTKYLFKQLSDLLVIK